MDFTFNKISASSKGLKIKDSNHLSRPSKAYESIKVPGRTGNLIIDDGSFNNKEIEITCFLDRRQAKDLITKAKEIGNWLQGETGYKELSFSDGSNFKAICSNQIDISQTIKNFAEVVIRFEVYEV